MSISNSGKRACAIAAGLALLGLPTANLPQPPQPGAAPRAAGNDAEAFRKAQEEFNKVPNAPGDGPYPAIVETDPSLPNHVIYRPANLAPFEATAGSRLGQWRLRG